MEELDRRGAFGAHRVIARGGFSGALDITRYSPAPYALVVTSAQIQI